MFRNRSKKPDDDDGFANFAVFTDCAECGYTDVVHWHGTWARCYICHATSLFESETVPRLRRVT